MEDKGLEPESTSPGKTLVDTEYRAPTGAYVVHSGEVDARWVQVRHLVESCADLPKQVRDYFVRVGDEAVQQYGSSSADGERMPTTP